MTKATSIRLPADGYKQLGTVAKANARSLNNQIIRVLRDWLSQRPPDSGSLTAARGPRATSPILPGAGD